MNSASKNSQTNKDQPDTKAKQINIRLIAEQERLLRQHCVRERVTTQTAVTNALKKFIDGF